MCALSVPLHLTITGWHVEASSESTVAHTQIRSYCVETFAMRGTQLCVVGTLINICEHTA